MDQVRSLGNEAKIKDRFSEGGLWKILGRRRHQCPKKKGTWVPHGSSIALPLSKGGSSATFMTSRPLTTLSLTSSVDFLAVVEQECEELDLRAPDSFTNQTSQTIYPPKETHRRHFCLRLSTHVTWGRTSVRHEYFPGERTNNECACQVEPIFSLV